MRSSELTLRCYAMKREQHWEAFCIDLCLAVQADSLADAKRKLEEQVKEYVEDALTIDREYARDLLNRKAPMKQRLEYFFVCVSNRLHFVRNGIHQAFRTILPVHVGRHGHA